ncbi:hypothetical protein BRADI_3g23055v3 [Brachypodium distachyon]|uniref:Trichome birefringence-like C-terminal domain-containing protein n=1 Tax=Brachypodium distachyon TaxID=15368 RepID=A0A0Q3F9D9_BRADI|nr:hypothetical protein BRADI_3g23055v3 [Brachypodium distachyon]
MVGKRLNVTTDIKEAFRLSLQTMTDWELSRARLSKSYFFFRSYSPSHYRNGTWDTGGSEEEYSWMNAMISSATRGLRTKGRNARFLNITYMTELRRDGHLSRHREPGTPPDAPEDCNHWCLPGVPDAWNQALYVHLLALGYDSRTKTEHR